MKVIFLDFDGVLNSAQFFKALYRQTGRSTFVREFCPIAASNLIHIISEVPDVKIVVSSSWRIGTELNELRKILKEGADVPEELVIDKTVFLGGERGHEIQEWLSRHPEVTKFVIIDDSSDMVHLTSYLVHTKWNHGLMLEDAEEVVRRLDPRTHCIECKKELLGGTPWLCRECLNQKLCI